MQYCGDGHMFMGAGEGACEILENEGYIEAYGDGSIKHDYYDWGDGKPAKSTPPFNNKEK